MRPTILGLLTSHLGFLSLATGTLRHVDSFPTLRLLWFLRRSDTTSATDSPVPKGRMPEPPTFTDAYVSSNFSPLLYTHSVVLPPSLLALWLFLKKNQSRFTCRLFEPRSKVASTQELTPSPSFSGVSGLRVLRAEVSLVGMVGPRLAVLGRDEVTPLPAFPSGFRQVWSPYLPAEYVSRVLRSTRVPSSGIMHLRFVARST